MAQDNKKDPNLMTRENEQMDKKALKDYNDSIRLEAKRLSKAIDEAVFNLAVESFGLKVKKNKKPLESEDKRG